MAVADGRPRRQRRLLRPQGHSLSAPRGRPPTETAGPGRKVLCRQPGLYDALVFGNLSSLIALAVAGILIAIGARLLPLAYTLFALAVVLLPLFGPTRLKPLMSMPRFILAAFPIFIVMALVSDRRPWLRVLLLAACLVGLVFLTVRFAGFWWVA